MPLVTQTRCPGCAAAVLEMKHIALPPTPQWKKRKEKKRDKRNEKGADEKEKKTKEEKKRKIKCFRWVPLVSQCRVSVGVTSASKWHAMSAPSNIPEGFVAISDHNDTL